MLRALCIDLMDTLVVDPYREALVAGTGLDLEDLRDLRDPEAWEAFELALIDEETFVRRFFAGAEGYHLDMDAFHRARREGYALVDGMGDLLGALAGHVERYVATNYPVWLEEVVEAFELRALTEGVFASHRLGVRKPDRAFFERLLDEIGHEPQHCLFVDDRADNCAAAAAVGMRVEVFRGAHDLRARLSREGLPV